MFSQKKSRSSLPLFHVYNKTVYVCCFLLPLLLCGCKPHLEILSPKDGGQFLQGFNILFSGRATGLNAGAQEDYVFSWSSSLDGALGTGAECSRNDLAIGSHTIALSATDSDGLVYTATAHIEVIDPGKTTAIRSAAELVTKLNSLTFSRQSGNPPITEDIQIEGTITVFSAQLHIPEGMAAGPFGLTQSVSFEDAYGAEGIALKPILPFTTPYGPAGLTLSDMTLRFRPLIIEKRTPPILCDFPVMQLLPPSDYECSAEQTRCPVDNVCYDGYQDYCRYCLALPQEECACRDEESTFADGSACQRYLGDMVVEGACKSGVCEINQ